MNWVDTTDLRSWANRRDCQETLPQLVRKLIRATSNSIKSIKFPSGENVLIGGWDGILVVSEETDYLPLGTSLWEFGANSDTKGKADDDYQKRTGNPLGFDPAESTFVFVTPRLWKKGDEWVTEKKKDGIWKDIRVINAEMLEEWLEIAPTVAAWLATKHLGKYPNEGIQPSEDFWDEWSSGPKINLQPQIVLGGRSQQVEELFSSLDNPALTAIQSTSRDETLAFIISAFKNDPDREEDFFARSLIVDTPEAFRQLSVLKTPLIFIARFEDEGIFNRAISNKHNVIVPLGADAAENWSDKIILPKIDRDLFVRSLTESGVTGELAEKYSRESLRNITILRRTLEFVRNIPDWAKPENVYDLIPALLVGRWDENYENDREIIARLANINYEEYAKKLTRWLYTSDSPIIKIGNTWRLASPLDAWINASRYLTRNDFTLLQDCFLEILGETNPAFELDPQQRHMAAIYGKVRQYSGWIREGVSQSLILVALFGSQLRFDLPGSAESWINQIVARLLMTTDSVLWKSFEHNLPLIAEAAPSEFLSQVENHLSSDDSPVRALFQEEPGFLTANSYHTGLLWALEGIAWLPEYLSRSSLVLAKLAAVDPGGSLSNRPINSLSGIFKPWYYQTLASFSERVDVLKLIADREREIGWILLMRMLPEGGRDVGIPSHKMRWRRFDETLNKPITHAEIWKMHSTAVDILLSVFDSSEPKLAKLIERSVNMGWVDRDKVLSFIEANYTSINQTTYQAWYSIRRVLSHHRSFPDADWALHVDELTRYEKLYNLLAPTDEVIKVQWMFDEQWPSFADGIDRLKLSHEEQEQLINDRRVEGLTSIYKVYGIEKIKELSMIVKEPIILGNVTGQIIDDQQDILSIAELLNTDDDTLDFFRGFMFRMSIKNGIEWMFQLYKQLEGLGYADSRLAFIILPLNQSGTVWNFIDSLNEEVEHTYWSKVHPHFYHLSIEEKIRGLNYLLDYKRYISAVHVCALFVDEIPTELLVKLLTKLATERAEENVRLMGYEIQRFFDVLDKRDDVELQTLIQLEWLYISILDNHGSGRSTKHLHDELSQNPDFFIEVFKYVHKPGDGSDETEPEDLSGEQLENRGMQAFRLLHSWKQIPGINSDGKINKEFLDEWINRVRDIANRYGRLEAADSHIGQSLAQYNENGEHWPPDEICSIIEQINTDSIKAGFSSATYNKRGSSSRGPFDGGTRERELVAYFNRLAAYQRNRFPNVAIILERLAKGYEQEAKREDDDAERSSLDY
ncbi:hypothetical protein [Spirosoma endophyticum]|uniref:Uncharacterized protein n=1 Tax=Spirosoma endophyticum TaxID=662367 RepID=A0A1I2E475_9BACT|nr:hypothetical protein [Spirosoma endophyticum]SFE87722.1 hypothetical protein SAMN05216167_12119 [Spirosoma endophyticum]